MIYRNLLTLDSLDRSNTGNAKLGGLSSLLGKNVDTNYSIFLSAFYITHVVCPSLSSNHALPEVPDLSDKGSILFQVVFTRSSLHIGLRHPRKQPRVHHNPRQISRYRRPHMGHRPLLGCFCCGPLMLSWASNTSGNHSTAAVRLGFMISIGQTFSSE